MTPLTDDEALEREIETARRAAMKASDPDAIRDYFAAMGMLIARRSPAQVARMESERGLRAP